MNWKKTDRSLMLILNIFPVEREEKLKKSELKDIEINMQAFIFNVFGVLDNLAWVFVFDRKLEIFIKKKW